MSSRFLLFLLICVTLLAAFLPAGPVRAQAPPPPPCETVDVTDPNNDRQATGQSLPPSVTGFEQVEFLRGCIAESLATLDFVMTVQSPPTHTTQDNNVRNFSFTVILKNEALKLFTLRYQVALSNGAQTTTGAPGAATTVTGTEVRISVPRASLENRPGAAIYDVVFYSHGTFVLNTGEVLTARDRMPNTGVLFASPAPYRQGQRAPPELDSDGDGESDRSEIGNGTDPSMPDTDFDGLLDGNNLEVGSGSPEASNFSAAQILLLSDDGTTAVFGGEKSFGTNATSPDTDGDGLLDGGNISAAVGSNATAHFQRFNVTSFSDDGINALYLGEFPFGLSPVNIDTDADGLRDRQDVTGSENQRYPNEAFYLGLPGSTSGLLLDTDAEGLSDFDETSGTFTMPDGSQRTFPPTNPNVPDTDQDGLTDYEEVTREPPTDPTNADTDGDGYLDGDEVEGGGDPVDPNRTPQTGGDGDQPGANEEFSYLLLSAIATLIIGLLCVIGILVRWG